MKELATWEMIKELTEHPKKRYKTKIGNIAGLNDEGILSWLNANEEIIELGKTKVWDNLNIKWTEAIEPVDFITAYSDCLENGTVYKGVSCDRWNCESQTMKRWKSGEMVTVKDKYGGSAFLDCKWIKEV